jgi:hypothetical protein
MKKLACYLTLCCLAALPGFSQPRFTGFVGAGPSVPVNPLGSHLDNGWDISAGGGITSNHLGLMLDFQYNNFGINSNTLSQVQAPGGTTRIWAFTLDPVVHLTQEGPVDVYVTGGGGIYHRNVEFTSPGVASTTFFSPWFGFYPALVPTTQVLASYTTYHGGVDGGAGISYKLGSTRAKVFAEARFNYMFTRGVASSYVPVTIGLRW